MKGINLHSGDTAKFRTSSALDYWEGCLKAMGFEFTVDEEQLSITITKEPCLPAPKGCVY